MVGTDSVVIIIIMYIFSKHNKFLLGLYALRKTCNSEVRVLACIHVLPAQTYIHCVLGFNRCCFL